MRTLPSFEREVLLARMEAWKGIPEPDGSWWDGMPVLSPFATYVDTAEAWQVVRCHWQKVAEGVEVATVWVHDPVSGEWSRV